MRPIRFLTGGLAALLLALWGGFLLLRDLPPGAYQPDLPAMQGGDDLIEVSRLIPLITFRHAANDEVQRALFIPVLRQLLPLGRDEPGIVYMVSDGGVVTLMRGPTGDAGGVDLRPISAEAHREWRALAKAARQSMRVQFQRIAGATLTPSWSAPILDGRLGLHLPDDLMLAVDQNDPGQGAAIRFVDHPRGDRAELSIIRSDAGGAAIAAFRDRFAAARDIGQNRWLARTYDGDFHLIAAISDDAGEIALARGHAPDEAGAARLMAVLNGLSLGGAPYALASGDYIGPAAPTPAELRRMIGAALSPVTLLRADTAAQNHTTDAAADGMGGMQVTMRIGVLPEGAPFPEADFSVLAEQPGLRLRVEADAAAPRCFPQRYVPIGPAEPSGQWVLALQSYGASLPLCRDLAGIFAGLDLEALPQMQIARRLAPHIGKYDDLRMEAGQIIATGAAGSAVFDAAGHTRLRVPAKIISSNRAGYVIRSDGREGLIDQQGRTILPMDYDDLSLFRHLDPQTTLLAVGKSGKQGLYVPERAAFLLPPDYDSFTLTGHGSLILAHRGRQFAVYDLTRGAMLPGLFTDFILGQPARASASGSDFVALRQGDGGWIFWTRTAQPMLAGRFRDVTLKTGPATREFHLIRDDGSRFAINAALETVPRH